MFYFDEAKHCYWLLKDGVKTPLIGTTRITGNLDKSGLTWWSAGMACAEFGWLNSKKNDPTVCQEAARMGLERIRGMSLGEYTLLLDKAYKAHNQKKKDSAEDGKDLHKELENYILAHMAGQEAFLPDPRIASFIEFTRKNVKRFLFTELCTYSEVLHTAGTADFGYEDIDGHYVLGDFKSSEAAYYSMYLQVGAYDFQISETGGYTQQGKKIFHLEKPFQRYEIFAFRAGLDKPFITTETTRLKRAFVYAANLYREQLWWTDSIDKKESGIKTFYNGRKKAVA